MRTLERAFNALALSLGGAAHRQRADGPSSCSSRRGWPRSAARHYRRFVHGDADFYAWFQAVTPIDVIARMQIGSRPAVRPGKEGFDALRAVPWVFAWTQSRHMLPAWYRRRLRACERPIEELGLGVARSAYNEWNFFTTLIDDLEASLSRADLDIAAAYEDLAREPPAAFRRQTTRGVRAGVEQVLAIKQIEALLDRDQTMQRSIELRNPVRGSDQPAAGRSTKAMEGIRPPGPRFVRIAAGVHRGHCRRTAEYWMMSATYGYIAPPHPRTRVFAASREFYPYYLTRAPAPGLARAALHRHLGRGHLRRGAHRHRRAVVAARRAALRLQLRVVRPFPVRTQPAGDISLSVLQPGERFPHVVGTELGQTQVP